VSPFVFEKKAINSLHPHHGHTLEERVGQEHRRSPALSPFGSEPDRGRSGDRRERSSVDKMVLDGALPPPRRWHTRPLWLVAEIEAHLNEWPIDGQAPADHNEWDDIGLAIPATKPVKGRGGFLVVTAPSDSLKQFYDRLGFNPKTMGEDEFMELQRAANERWRVSVPGTPMGKRELSALAQLASHGAGVFVPFASIKGCGPDTEERLQARGFLEIRAKSDGRVEGYVLTSAGLRAHTEVRG
jgi:hypothetical protein